MRNAYPRPQMVRSHWQNLNGIWQFGFDDADRGFEEKWYLGEKDFDQEIQVPFVYQCRLSGICTAENHEIVWYKRRFEAKKTDGQRTILHFGAVDYEAAVFLNGNMVCRHEGGYTSFSADITDYMTEREQVLVVRVYDPLKEELIPRGKQIWEESPRGIWYTDSTGIWQSVWLENVNKRHISDIKWKSLFDEGKENIRCSLSGTTGEERLRYSVRFQGQPVCEGTAKCYSGEINLDLDLIQNHIFRTNFHDHGWSWSPEKPNLFDVTVVLEDGDGTVLDQVESYFGFRKVHIENRRVYLNNKPYYQRLVLDQGYWPDGLMTAPDDDDFRRDIELAKEMGFNGCRKHQKTEDPIFLYWADRLGYLVWGECASSVMYGARAVKRLMTEWTEIVDRDYSHPSIVTWVPLNESWGMPHIHQNPMQQHFSLTMYHFLHALDDTRPVISNDGWEMTETDICAIHNYAHGQKEETEKFACYREMLSSAENLVKLPSTSWDIFARGFEYRDTPIILTEFGGIGFELAGANAWGYTAVENEEEFLSDYGRIMDAVFASTGLCGFCYTQLTDVEQEMNGLLTYDRKPKCDPAKIRAVNRKFHRGVIGTCEMFSED